MFLIRWRGAVSLRPHHVQSPWLSRADWMAQEPFRSFGLLEVTRIRPCTLLRWTLALWLCHPLAPSRRTLKSWWVPVSPARSSKVAAKGRASGSSAGRWPAARVCRPSCGQVPPAIGELLRGLFEPGMIKFRKWPVITLESFPCGKRLETKLIIDARIPNMAFEASDLVALATGQSFARVNVDSNEPIFVGGVDIQVALYAKGLPEDFQKMFALDPIEAWEVDFARVVDQGNVDSWNEAVCTVLAVVLVGWSQALNVCQWVYQHVAGRASGISEANRFTDFVAVRPLSS